MSGKSLVDQIRHYQKDIERCPENSERMIRCIQRLYVLPIQVLHLQETGVGRSVNSLRKYKGEVGEAAKALVAKWKAMVAAEESSDDCNDKIKSDSPDSKLNKSSVSNVKVEPKYEKPVIKVEPKSEKPIIKTEPKSDKQEHVNTRDKYSSKDKSSSRDNASSKDRSSSRDNTSSKENSSSKSHHSSSRHHSESHVSRSHSSSLKRSHPSSEKSHSSEKKSSSHQNHKSSHNEKRHSSDEEMPSSPKKHKKHHSHSRNHSTPKEQMVESEEEADEEEANDSGDDRSEPGDSTSDSEKESSEESENSSVEEEVVGRLSTLEEEEEEQESDNSSSDHRHRSKHKSSHHKHGKSSHSHSDKNKENHSSHKSSSRDSCKKSSKESKSSSKHLNELIKENEKKIKKEKDEFQVPKYIPTKIVKVERNEDGSIDSGSGASFADALLGMDNFVEPKKKKKSLSKESSSSSNHKSSSSTKTSSSHRKQHSQSSSHSSSKEKSKESSSKTRSIEELLETPELLTKKVKLEALDLDISSTLPEINPNYKPLPHVPESSRRQMRMSEEDTMFSIMTTKNLRTKVYSGNKVYSNTVPSLFNLCIQLLYENIDAVEYTGGVPYNLLKPLLERLNSDQLYVIEHFNPYLIEDTDNLWKFHCSKDFRSQKRQDMESWRDLYLRCIEERERKLKAVTANISHSMAKSTPVRQAKLAYVDAVVKPPRSVARNQARYGTGSSSSSKSTPNINKQDILSKAIVGGHTPGVSAKDVVPPPPTPRAVHHSTPAVLKKKKAPLMQKALQFIKGNRFKR